MKTAHYIRNILIIAYILLILYIYYYTINIVGNASLSRDAKQDAVISYQFHALFNDIKTDLFLML